MMSLSDLVPPSWVLALLVCVSVSVFTVTGFVFQSRSLRDPEELKRYPRFGEVVLSPRWVFGFLLQTFPNFFGDVVAYSLAPLSLLAPLSGVAVALNTTIAPWMLGEKLHVFPDLPATGLILAGVVITSLSGSHRDHVEIRDSTMLLELLQNPVTFTVFCGLLLSLFTAWAIEEVRRAFIEAESKQQFDAPRLHFVVLAAWLAGGSGVITNIGLKVLSELLVAWEAQRMVCLATLLFGIIPAALGQQQALNKGLRLYPQTVFFPIYSSLLMLANTFFGAIFFEEYDGLIRGERGFIFTLGLVFVVIGIVLFSWRRGQQEMDSNHLSLKQALLNTDAITLPA